MGMTAMATFRDSFNASTTAEEVVGSRDLHGKLVVLTGATAGIGAECARVLAQAGADLVLGARRDDLLTRLARKIGRGGEIWTRPLDLGRLASVDAFADEVLALDRPVDVLINNAGVMACSMSRTDAGFEFQLAVNYFGHALLASRLLSALRRRPGGRLVSLTSIAHHFGGLDLDDLNFERRPYNPWLSYGQTKTATALLAVKFQPALRAAGGDAFAVHPGIIPATELAGSLAPDARLAATALIGDRQTAPVATKTVGSGAASSIWAAVDEHLEGRGGAYLEDCSIAVPITEPNFNHGVLPYAIDPQLADRLWEETGRILGRTLSL
jgi:NAD(P)-dependent dehydrogenase (short-subunit alcohol dehydrogenase family)